ncbi:immunoglobulin lambda-1 light chain-like [Cyprinodon tularosa]|uniref:immunoglobulin lambda-1 light chain-like n=1 Tax=Cyprinodon tularosa TaxID=77115 RepID=UPI0018E25DEE|nr:immunoglobulin lambda-1 light chain-like [Cyprinodon tularosa]
MLFLPAAALCCLCSALAAMTTQLSQEDLTLTRRVGDSVSFSCGTDQCGGYVVTWYQKNESETFRPILFITSSGSTQKHFNHPQQNDFSAERNQKSCTLKLNHVKVDHSASYYCGCWKSGWNGFFGSGTKLYVTEEQLKEPVVTVYPAASRAHLEGKSSLLCLASGMFPPEVKISWKRQKKDGDLEDLLPAEGEQLELREPGRTTSILLVDGDPVIPYKYHCSVQHEGGRVEAQTQQEVGPWILMFKNQVKLLLLLYTVLIVKSLVYCCGLSLLMSLRTKGPSTN